MINKYEQALSSLECDTDENLISNNQLMMVDIETIREALRTMKMVEGGTHVIVPVEPTEKMIKATECNKTLVKVVYSEMINAYTHKEE